MISGESISVLSSFAAAIAALAAWRTAYLTKEQFRIQQEDIINKYKPIFKINSTNPAPNGYLFDLVNIGFPFYSISAVNWDGESVHVTKDFNGFIERTDTAKDGNKSITRHDTLAVKVEVEPGANVEGYLEINGVDLNQKEFNYKSPLIIIKNGNITNGINVTHQFLK